MQKKKKGPLIIEEVEIIDVGSEGKAIAKVNDWVIFVPFTIPGDIVDLKITKKKKNYAEAKVIKYHKHSENRIENICEHFGICGGCKWQMMDYKDQLIYKQKQVSDNFQRIGKIETQNLFSIIPSEKIFYYRNKLEFTFSNKRWLLEDEKNLNSNHGMNALGFHIPQQYDKVLDINRCFLQEEPSNNIRNAIKKFSIENNYSFYNANTQEGFLRNVIIRISSIGEIMVIIVVKGKNSNDLFDILNFIKNSFPEITSLMYIINNKQNDTINDLDVKLYYGKPFIMESMKSYLYNRDLNYKIGPKSFYQTNSLQAYNLYKIAADFAQFKGNEIVYDLYTGTGTIANFIAESVNKVIGIEYIDEAIEDALINAEYNNIRNVNFFSGDILKVLNSEFITSNGKPDIIITDPPRAGMHEKVINQILEINPNKIVYISCNPATQARDISLMKDKYFVDKIQPVDMFPHTHHVENVVLLISKN